MNQICEGFELRKLSEDQFKCSIFVRGLQSTKDADVRMRLLTKLEKDEDCTIENLYNECQRIKNLKCDTHLIENSGSSNNIFKIEKQKFSSSSTDCNTKKIPPSACWYCGDFHYASQCPFKKNKCKNVIKLDTKMAIVRENRMKMIKKSAL